MKSPDFKLLIVEDNIAISENIAMYFEEKDTILDFAYDGVQACKLVLNNFYHVVVLDIAIPKMDGLQVCSELRSKSQRHIPIIMLTARDTLDDKLTGFAHGADDYLTKPFSLDELYARCLALTQRHTSNHSKELSICNGEQKLTLNIVNKVVTRNKQKINLQPIPFSILKLLMESYPRVITRSELCEQIWGEDQTSSDSLRSHLYQLRKAIDKPFNQSIIKTMHGVGFSIEL